MWCCFNNSDFYENFRACTWIRAERVSFLLAQVYEEVACVIPHLPDTGETPRHDKTFANVNKRSV